MLGELVDSFIEAKGSSVGQKKTSLLNVFMLDGLSDIKFRGVQIRYEPDPGAAVGPILLILSSSESILLNFNGKCGMQRISLYGLCITSVVGIFGYIGMCLWRKSVRRTVCSYPLQNQLNDLKSLIGNRTSVTSDGFALGISETELEKYCLNRYGMKWKWGLHRLRT